MSKFNEGKKLTMQPRSHYSSVGLQESEVEQQGMKSDSYSCRTFIRSAIFGGIDGLNTSIVIISAAAGANLSWKIVVIVGFSVIVASALAMGVGEYFSSRSHLEFIMAEKRRATWEFNQYKSNEIKEMIDKFERKGMTRSDAELVVTKMASYESFFVNLMVTEELGLKLDENQSNASDGYLLLDAVIMFFSYFLIGSFPFLIFFGSFSSIGGKDLFKISGCITIVAMFVMGAVKSKFSSVSWMSSGFETVFIGCVCAFLSYFVAQLASDYFFAL